MKVIRLLALVCFMMVCLATTQANAYTYSMDDGTGELAVGLNNAGTMTWMNQFDTVAGANNIKTVAIAWGTINPGETATIKVWADLNGDGNPSDRVLLTSLAVTPESPGANNHFIVYDIADVVVTGSFFVGVEMTNASYFYPAFRDTSTATLTKRSWAIVDGNVYGYFNPWLIRANAGAVEEVPEPASLLLLGFGLMGFIGMKRKLKK